MTAKSIGEKKLKNFSNVERALGLGIALPLTVITAFLIGYFCRRRHLARVLASGKKQTTALYDVQLLIGRNVQLDEISFIELAISPQYNADHADPADNLIEI